MTLVCAPAGFGKTTMLATWAIGHPRVAWVHLDQDDNDVYRLWSAILEAIRGAGNTDRSKAIARLSPPHDHLEQGFLAAFISAIDRSPEPVWLVLDDACRIRSAAAIDSLNMLLLRMPRGLRVIVASRNGPPIEALQRLRLDGRLREVPADLLTFSRGEAEALLATHDVHLPDGDLDRLLTRTEGWAAGLRLAGIALSAAADPSAEVTAFVRNDRNVADYLCSEFLAHQSAETQRFLLRTSVCERFTVELAETITERPAVRVLDALERSNFLISRLGGLSRDGERRQWYRYHAMVRDYFYTELHNRGIAAALHRKAASWFEANGDHEAAVEHAIDGCDTEMATRLLKAYGPRMTLAGSGQLLRRLLAKLPPAELAQPYLALLTAMAALEVGDTTSADAHLALVPASVGTSDDRQLRAIYLATHLIRALLSGDLPAALAALGSNTDIGSKESDLDLIVMAHRANAAYVLGMHELAEGDLMRAQVLAEHRNYDYLTLHCMVHLCSVKAAISEIPDVERTAERAIEFATCRGWTDDARCGLAYALGAWAAHLRMDATTARQYATKAIDVLVGSTNPLIELSAIGIDALIRFDEGQRAAACADLKRAWARLGSAPLHPAIMAHSAPVEAGMALATGDPGWAAEIIDRVRGIPGASGEVNLMRAMVNQSRGRTDVARRLLAPVLTDQLPHLTELTKVRAWLLEAVLAHRSNDGDRVRAAIEEAVALAGPKRALRPFADAGQDLFELLAANVGRFGRWDDFVVELVATLRGRNQNRGAPLSPLTPRELQLLAELPSMRTVEQIAEDLFLSPSTVKTHLRGVYRKLEVSGRRDAVAKGRRLGLI